MRGPPQLIDNFAFKYIYIALSIDHSRNILCFNLLECSRCGGLHSRLITLCSFKSSYVNGSCLKYICCNVWGCSKCGGLHS